MLTPAVAPGGASNSMQQRYDRFKANDIDKDRSALLAVGSTGDARATEELYSAFQELVPNVHKDRAAIVTVGALAGHADAARAAESYEAVYAAEPNLEKFRGSLLTNAVLSSGRQAPDVVELYRGVKAAVPDIDATRAATITTAAAVGGASPADAARVYEDLKVAVPDIDRNRAALLASAALLTRTGVADTVGAYDAIQAAVPDIDKHRAATLVGASLLSGATPAAVADVYRGYTSLDIDKDRAAVLTVGTMAAGRPTTSVFAAAAWLQLGSERFRDEALSLAAEARRAQPDTTSWSSSIDRTQRLVRDLSTLATTARNEDARARVLQATDEAEDALRVLRSGVDGDARDVERHLARAERELVEASRVGAG